MLLSITPSKGTFPIINGLLKGIGMVYVPNLYEAKTIFRLHPH